MNPEKVAIEFGLVSARTLGVDGPRCETHLPNPTPDFPENGAFPCG